MGIDLSNYDEDNEGQDYDVWPEHHQSVDVFVTCVTQWRVGTGGLVGLDYGVVFDVMNLYDVTDRLQTLTDVRIMEGKAMEILNARAKREASR